MSEIRLSTYGETIEIQQGINGRVVVQVQTDDGAAAPVLTPPECDALIAALHKALGRAPTLLEERLAQAAKTADAAGDDEASCERASHAHGRAAGLRAALVMAREAGPTVPRAGVAAVVDRLARVAAVLESDDRFAQREARQVLWKVLDDMKGMVDGVPVATMVPRTGVEAIVAEIDALTNEDERAVTGIRASLTALLAAASAPTRRSPAMLTIERVTIPIPTVRCAAPLCGDKIKNGRTLTCWFDGERYYHEFCRDKDGNERREDDGHADD